MVPYVYIILLCCYLTKTESFSKALTEIAKSTFNKSTLLLIVGTSKSKRIIFNEEENIFQLLKTDHWATYITNNFYVPPPNLHYYQMKKVMQVMILLSDEIMKSPQKLADEVLKWSQNPVWSNYASVIVATETHNEIEFARAVLTEFWRQLKAANVVIVAKNLNHEISLYSWKPYSPGCEINVERIGSWNKSLTLTRPLFPIRSKWNVHKCKIVAAYALVEPFVFASQGSKIVNDGFELLLFQAVANVMNFSVEFVSAPAGQSPYSIFINGVPAGIMGRIYRHEADIVFYGVRAMWERYLIADPLIPCFAGNFVWAAPLPEKIPTWMIFFLVFQKYLWCATLVTFILTTTILRLITKAGIGKTLLFTWSIFFNNPTPYNSTRDALRIFLSFYFLYVLNITSAYQSGLFRLLSSGMADVTFQSADEAVTLGFRATIYPSAKNEIQTSSPKFYETITSLNLVNWSEDSRGTRHRIGRQNKEIGLLSDISLKYAINQRFTSSSGKQYIRILKERYGAYDPVYYMSREHPLKPAFEDIMRIFLECGIAQFFIKSVLDKPRSDDLSEVKDFIEIDESQSINLQQILGAFILLFCLLIFSSLCFLLEVLISFFSSTGSYYDYKNIKKLLLSRSNSDRAGTKSKVRRTVCRVRKRILFDVEAAGKVKLLSSR